VFYDLGFLSAVEVVECSATDLIGQYVGQTGPKTLAQMEKGLGKVLFIDEAYRLASGHFAQEAMDELVGLMTQDKFKEKMIIILAGYDGDMDRLLEVNQGLRSRFSEDVFFEALTPQQCLKVLWSKLSKNKINIPSLDQQAPEIIDLRQVFKQLASLQNWGNARDIETLCKKMVEIAYTTLSANGELRVSLDSMKTCANDMLKQRMRVSKKKTTPPTLSSMFAQPDLHQPPTISTQTSTTTESSQDILTPDDDSDEDDDFSFKQPEKPSSQIVSRDPGVSEDIWQQLQQDIAKAKERERILLSLQEQAIELAREHEAFLARQAEDQARMEKEEEERKQKAERDAEEARLQAELLRERQEEGERLRKAAALERKRLEEEMARVAAALKLAREQKAREELAQSRLRQMGVCEAGFAWIQQPYGYRCAAGGHFVSNAALGF
jgi:hypothetical protein